MKIFRRERERERKGGERVLLKTKAISVMRRRGERNTDNGGERERGREKWRVIGRERELGEQGRVQRREKEREREREIKRERRGLSPLFIYIYIYIYIYICYLFSFLHF